MVEFVWRGASEVDDDRDATFAGEPGVHVAEVEALRMAVDLERDPQPRRSVDDALHVHGIRRTFQILRPVG